MKENKKNNLISGLCAAAVLAGGIILAIFLFG